ncbi:uncharacterized protein LOC119082168 [Bradysia coprophila]|uniref:uncharacterized protein LOC119082168 n=1 Tax=Bradysia coprophila TaxID=38358 RepID=UPI00187DA8F8|nr:uncharacterized protein LOC119082168 [Bradysia coprophila]
MPSRRKIKTENVSNASILGVATRRISVQIKRLAEIENMKSIKALESTDTPLESTDTSLLEVEKWQQEICDHLKKMNHLGVLKESDRVFNMKDVYFPLGPRTASPCLTTLIMICASGIMAPTTVFFPNSELSPRTIFDDETSSANLSEVVLQTNDRLLGYMKLIFHPWLIAKRKSFPVIVFIDIDPVHISWEFLSFCKENQIILLRNTSAVSLHPITSFVIPHIENAWMTALLEWNNKHQSQQIAMDLTPSILEQVFVKTMTVDLLTDAFRKCGTFPFDPATVYKQGMMISTSLHTIDSIRQLGTTLQSMPQPDAVDLNQSTIEISQQEVISDTASFDDETPTQQKTVPVPEHTVHPTYKIAQTTLTAQSTATAQFQVLLGPLTYEFINSGSSWTGAVENTSLFEVWQILLKSHQHLTHPIPQTAHEINKQFRIQFEGFIGPLLYEFKKSGNVWMGATENRGLFEVWKQLTITLEDKSDEK